MPNPPKILFTFCSGRCGTGSVAKYFEQYKEKYYTGEKDNFLAFHELLNGEMVGEMTPGTETLTNYNIRGFKNETVQRFWANKLANLHATGMFQEDRIYIETSHVLGKAGLMEFILQYINSVEGNMVKPEIYILFLNRNPLDTIASMYVRGDFHSLENRRSYYLEPSYSRNSLLYDAPTLPFNDDTSDLRLSHIAWYYWEMRVRQVMWMDFYAELFHPFLRIYELPVDDEFHSGMEELMGDMFRENVALDPIKENETIEPLKFNLPKVKEMISSKHQGLLLPFEGIGEEALVDFIDVFKEDFLNHFIHSQGLIIPEKEEDDGSIH